MTSMVDVSFSRVQTYQRCPWLYNLVYNLGWRSGPTAPSALGQSLHKSLAEFYALPQLERTEDRLFEIFDSNWVNEGFLSTQKALEAYESGRSMLAQHFQIERDRPFDVLYTEKEFSLDLGKAHFRGTVDRLDRAADGCVEIVEYKTNDENWSEMRIANDLQMTMYQIGVTEGLKLSPVRLKYLFLSSGRSVITSRSDQQIEEAKMLLQQIAFDVGAEKFTPNHDYCDRCEFGRRCDKSKLK